MSFYRKGSHHFYQCTNCHGIYRDPATYLTTRNELKRYLTHNNDVNDLGYQQFVMPLVTQVKQHFDPKQHNGLDFGAGPGPVITKLLNDAGFKLALYDPYFHPDRTVLDSQYDFIVCCEVMEHFYSPDIEFKKLRRLLKENGQLLCKTSLFDKEISFDAWYYKDDPTHVFIYTLLTTEWIAATFGFRKVVFENGILVFSV